MKSFNRQVMLRLVNHDLTLAKEYQQRLLSKPIDTVLNDMFLTTVIYKQQYRDKYDSLFDQSDDLRIVPDPPLVKAIRELVAANGWPAFVDALAKFANQKRISTYLIGMRSTSDLWKKIAAQFEAIRKTVQN